MVDRPGHCRRCAPPAAAASLLSRAPRADAAAATSTHTARHTQRRLGQLLYYWGATRPPAVLTAPDPGVASGQTDLLRQLPLVRFVVLSRLAILCLDSEQQVCSSAGVRLLADGEQLALELRVGPLQGTDQRLQLLEARRRGTHDTQWLDGWRVDNGCAPRRDQVVRSESRGEGRRAKAGQWHALSPAPAQRRPTASSTILCLLSRRSRIFSSFISPSVRKWRWDVPERRNGLSGREWC